MAVERRLSTGFLYRRRIEKIAGGAKIDWNAKPVIDKLEAAIARTNKRGALKLKRTMRTYIAQRAYDTGP